MGRPKTVNLATFPDKEIIYFYELNSILNSYCWGTFGGGEREINDENAKYYTLKYNHFTDKTPEIQKAYDEYKAVPREKEKERQAKYDVYHTLMEDYVYENFNLNDTFKDIGDHAVCYPVAFTHNTAEWSKEKYGKLIGYAHAGEIYFVATKDKVFFNVSRHF